jgi:hypothetical protein
LSDWTLSVPERLNEEIAGLGPDARRVVYTAFRALVADPRAGRLEPVTGAELRRALTEPLPGTDQRITIMYRVIEAKATIAVIWLIAGP